MSIAADIVEIAREKGMKVTCAESCTGGMISAALTEIPGSSAMFERGFVTYSNTAKSEMLAVPEGVLDSHGAVSEPVAASMADGALRAAQADIAVAVSGIAGPGGSAFKPEGRVCYGLATAKGVSTQTIDHGALGRDKVREAARDHALALIHTALNRLGRK